MSNLGILLAIRNASPRFVVEPKSGERDNRTYALSIFDFATRNEHCSVTGHIIYKDEIEKRAAYICARLNDREDEA